MTTLAHRFESLTDFDDKLDRLYGQLSQEQTPKNVVIQISHVALINKITYSLISKWPLLRKGIKEGSLKLNPQEEITTTINIASFLSLTGNFSMKSAQIIDELIEPLKANQRILYHYLSDQHSQLQHYSESLRRHSEIVTILVEYLLDRDEIQRDIEELNLKNCVDPLDLLRLMDALAANMMKRSKHQTQVLQQGDILASLSQLIQSSPTQDYQHQLNSKRQSLKKLKLNLEMSLVNFGKANEKHKAKPAVTEFEQLLELIENHKMVILSGIAQSGKSTLVESYIKAVTEAGNIKSHIRIYATESLDTKTLIGNYVCGQSVGEFEWKNGPITAIVECGGILVVENLQDAKDDLISILIDILKDELNVRGEHLRIKDSFRILAVCNNSTEPAQQKVADLKRACFEIGELQKKQVELKDLLRKHQRVAENSLTNTLFNEVEKMIKKYNADAKCEFKAALVDLERFVVRISDLFERTFKSDENPLHFSVNFKFCIVHIFFDVFLARLRSQIPLAVLEDLGQMLKLTSNEITNYLAAYSPNLIISQTGVKSNRYGNLLRTEFTETNSRANSASASTKSLEFFSTSLVGNLVESIIGCSRFNDHLLLVGEAGSGKTTVVQETSRLLGKHLYVYNLSQSSDINDLVGGYKPLNAKTLISELAIEFGDLIRNYFDYQKNIKLISYLNHLIVSGKHLVGLAYMLRECKNIVQQTIATEGETKRARKVQKFELGLKKLASMQERLESSLIFKYIEGNLVNALRKGGWILLDEINLAQADVLQAILPILENRSIILIEKGELKEIKRHPDFKIFGCMNPGGTIGKKELPATIRKNFVEYFVKELEDPREIASIVRNQSKMMFQDGDYDKITSVYLAARKQVQDHLLVDGFNRKPTISLRALSRAVEIAMVSQSFYPNLRTRGVMEGLFAALSSNLSLESKEHFVKIMKTHFDVDEQFLNKAQESSKKVDKAGFINVEGFLLAKGTSQNPKPNTETNFLLTGSVKRNMCELLRVVAHSKYPVLLEGPTSAGKTSMIKFLGEISGNKVVRINNHQHTDLDEYIGTYSPDETGRLVFKEGLLVEAMRKGYWLILDELNLARSEILEALNRLLDDNRELYIPEINELVRPHADFRIFATQNPLDYGGRKELSIAFRSRFFNFFIRDIDDEDLVKIIETRCQVPESRSKKLVEIMKALRILRSRQNVFSGKESMITIRDLLKWASREIVDINQMAINGYCLLAERLRFDAEREQVKKVILDKTVKGEEFDPCKIYRKYFEDSVKEYSIPASVLDTVFWSNSFTRMYSLMMMGFKKGEPILLIGETGSGKTTIAEIIGKIFGVELYTVNCHQYTESSDFLGGLRPVRNKEETLKKAAEKMNEIQELLNHDTKLRPGSVASLAKLRSSINASDRSLALEVLWNHIKSDCSEDEASLKQLELVIEGLRKDIRKLDQLFEWVDGPLIQAMTKGGVLLIDEISLAQDSVLERLNSVLEQEKTLTLSEKGDGSIQEITAVSKFFIIGTMNPAGDYGKKELTPALRNRFTEVWVEPVTAPKILEEGKESLQLVASKDSLDLVAASNNDFIQFVMKELLRLESSYQFIDGRRFSLSEGRSLLCLLLYKLVSTFNHSFALILKPLTVRDIKSSLPYFFKDNQCRSYDALRLEAVHDYLKIVIGGFKCMDKLVTEAALLEITKELSSAFSKLSPDHLQEEPLNEIHHDENSFGIGSYSIQKIKKGMEFEDPKYSIEEPTVKANLKSILMSMRLDKSIMLEGPPGVGKTSLIQHLANIVGIKFYRVNLNEQTDMIDLLGSDVPSSSSAVFVWADGVLVQAMKEGSWILLDELNMATQTVLEGLNSILDHRGSIYISELDKTVTKHPNFRIFASQNPMSMGSGRKGLPHSFLTRFTRVWIDELSRDSMEAIIMSIYSQYASTDLFVKMVKFFFDVKEALSEGEFLGKWEFNLRDLHVMIEIMKQVANSCKNTPAEPDYKRGVQKAITVVIFGRLEDEASNILVRDLFRKRFENLKLEAILDEIVTSESSLPQHLNHHKLDELLAIAAEPFIHNLTTAIEVNHPVLLLFDSRSNSTVYQLENAIQLLKDTKYSKTNLKSLSLFSSSDIIDLIGSYEQSHFIASSQQAAIQKLLTELNCSRNTAEGTELMAPSGEGKLLEKPNILNFIAQAFSFDSSSSQISFEWHESELCKSIRRGDWVLLKGAELVNPAILERLNGLLEEKEIFINEAIGSGNEVEILRKHENFRIFIFYDIAKAKQAPSRALRNRCIELNHANFELMVHHFKGRDTEELKDELPNLINSLISGIVDPLSQTSLSSLKHERLAKFDRLRENLKVLKKSYSKFISEPSDHQLPLMDRTVKELKELIISIYREVTNRRNYTFSKKLQTNQASQPGKPLESHSTAVKPYEDQHLFRDNTKILFNFIHRLIVLEDPSNSSRQSLKLLWHNMKQQISKSNTRDDIEDTITAIDSSEAPIQMLVAKLCQGMASSNREFNKWFLSIGQAVTKINPSNSTGSESESGKSSPHGKIKARRFFTEGGFANPLNFALNLLFSFMLSRSTDFSSVIDKSAPSVPKLRPANQAYQLQPAEANLDLWTVLTTLLSRRMIQKLKFITNEFKDIEPLIKDLKMLVQKTIKDALRTKSDQQDQISITAQQLVQLLQLVVNFIESEYSKISTSLTSMFVKFINDDQPRILLNTGSQSSPQEQAQRNKSIVSVMRNLKIIDELEMSEEQQKVSNYVQDSFQNSLELLKHSFRLTSIASKQTDQQVLEHFDLLSKLFHCSDDTLPWIKALFEDDTERQIKNAIKVLGTINFEDFKVTEVDILKLIKAQLEAAPIGEGNVAPILEKLTEELGTIEASSAPSYFAEDLQAVKEICEFAENPNLNTLTSMVKHLFNIQISESQVVDGRLEARETRRSFDSLFNHLNQFKSIKSSLDSIGSVLKSQKTRRLSKFQFDATHSQAEAAKENAKNETETYHLSDFLSNCMFKLLSKSSHFLADADVQEMKRIHAFCCSQIHKLDALEFDQVDRAIEDTQRLLKSFVNNGGFVSFGDFLLPYFSKISKCLLFLRMTSQKSYGTMTIDTLLENPKVLLESLIPPSTTTNLPPQFLKFFTSSCVLLSLVSPLKGFQTVLEAKLMEQHSAVIKDEQLARGRTFDEASRLRNLQKGIERTVKDEYQKETVEKNKEEKEWELQQIFGLESEIQNHDKFKTIVEGRKLKELRLSYFKGFLNNTFLTNNVSTKSAAKSVSCALTSLIYNVSPNNKISLHNYNAGLLFNNIRRTIEESIQKSLSPNVLAGREVRNIIMLDLIKESQKTKTPLYFDIETFEEMYERQLNQYLEIHESSFYRGNCCEELVRLRVLLFDMLERIKKLRENEDLRELPNFNNMIGMANFIMNLQLSKTNLNEVCLAVEKISQYILDYESITPKSCHMPDIKERVRDTLYEYRQKERKSWRGLVFCQGLETVLADLEEAVALRSALVDELRKDAQDERSAQQAVDLVDAFLAKTSLGKQPFRVFWLLRGLRHGGKNLLETTRTGKLLRHLLAYHLSFTASLLTVYAQQFDATVTEALGVQTNLANWQMKDFANLKADTHKFHRGVQRAMHRHREVLELGLQTAVYRRRRDAYRQKSTAEAHAALCQAGEISPPAPQPNSAEAAKTAKSAPPVLTRRVVDAAVAAPQFAASEQLQAQVRANIRLFRLVAPQVWLRALGCEAKPFAYARYESAVAQAQKFIGDWMDALFALSNSDSKAHKFRVLDGFLKLLHSMGVRERTTVDNWDALKTFALCLTPAKTDAVRPELRAAYAKTVNRVYEMVDLLHVNRTDLAYHADVPLMLRRRMQGFMVHLTNRLMSALKHFAKVLAAIGRFSALARQPSEYFDLAGPSKARLDRLEARLAKAETVAGKCAELRTEKLDDQRQLLASIRKFRAGQLSLAEVNAALEGRFAVAKVSAAQAEEARRKFAQKAASLQRKLAADAAVYDRLAKEKTFFEAIPWFLKSLCGRFAVLGQLQGCGDEQSREVLRQLCEVFEHHLVESLAVLVKFGWLSARVMHVLIFEGVCVKKAQDGENDGEEGSSEWDFGEGVGEGKGEKDGTEKYEFEEQVLGNEKGEEESVDEEEQAEGKGEDEADEERDEKGGMEMDNEFEGENEREKDEKEEKGEEDDEMDAVDEEDEKIDQDLWDEENEERRDESEKEEERREVEDKQFEDRQQRKDDGEQRAKEPTDKQERQADDFEEQPREEQAEDEAANEADEEEEEAKKDDEEYAEVESRSSMSSRNENKQMDFEDEQQEEEKEEDAGEDGQEEVEQEGVDEQEVEEEEEGGGEEYEDGLKKEERRMEEEEKQQGDEAEEVQVQHEAADDDAKEKNEQQDDEGKGAEVHEKQGNDANDLKNDAKKKNAKQKKDAKQEDKKDAQEDGEEDLKEDKEDKDTKNRGLEEEEKRGVDDRNNDHQKDGKREENEVLKEMHEKCLELMEGGEDASDGGEGVEEGGVEEVRVKRKEQRAEEEERREEQGAKKAKRPKGCEEQELREEEQPTVRKEREEQQREAEEAEREDGDEVEEVGQATKKLRTEAEETMDADKPHTLEEVAEQLRLLADEDAAQVSQEASPQSWAAIEASVRTRACSLTEELRSVLKPTKVAGLKGDYRTGKRLNMRKVVAYVASNFRKDRMWLRRSDPSQRDYEIALAIDDTLSMSEKNVGFLALEALITLALALSKLDVGKLSISGIRNGLHTVLPFATPFTSADGQRIVSNFTFAYSDPLSADFGLTRFLQQIADTFTAGPHVRMLFIVGDGKCNKELVRPMVRRLEETGVLVVYVVLDRKDEKGSVLSLRSTVFEETATGRKARIRQFLDDFPFANYLLVERVSDLASVLLAVLRDFFSTLE